MYQTTLEGGCAISSREVSYKKTKPNPNKHKNKTQKYYSNDSSRWDDNVVLEILCSLQNWNKQA